MAVVNAVTPSAAEAGAAAMVVPMAGVVVAVVEVAVAVPGAAEAAAAAGEAAAGVKKRGVVPTVAGKGAGLGRIDRLTCLRGARPCAVVAATALALAAAAAAVVAFGEASPTTRPKPLLWPTRRA